MNTVTVKINGVEYNLRGKEDEKYLFDVAAYVDSKIKEISVSNKKLSISSVAVLTAVNIADELFKCDLEISDITKKKNSLEERHLTLKERLRELKVEIDENARTRASEVDSLKNIIFSMEEKLNEFEKIKNENESLKLKVEELTKTIEQDKSSIEHLTIDLKTSKEKNMELEKTIANCTEEIKSRVAIEDYDEISTKLQKVQRINTILISENDELKEKNLNNLNDINIMKEENSKLKEENNNIKEKQEDLEQSITIKEIEFEEIKNAIEKEKEDEVANLKIRLTKMENEVEDNIKKKEMFKERNKEMNFQLQNLKYKVLDLEKKLIDTQVNLAVEKKDKNPLLR